MEDNKIRITEITRDFAISALSELISICEQLAIDSIRTLNESNFRWSTVAKIDLGFDLRKNLLAVHSLAKYNLDDQIFIIYRSIFENVITMEYLCKRTKRGNRQLTPAQKAFLFVSFPEYCKGLINPEFQKSRDFKRISLRRKKIIGKGDRYWHGLHLRGICEELDNARKDSKTPNGDYCDILYSALSFATHPNSKETIHYVQDSMTNEIKLRPFFHFAENIFIATLWASKGIRRWAVALRTKRVNEIDNIIHNWKLTI